MVRTPSASSKSIPIITPSLERSAAWANSSHPDVAPPTGSSNNSPTETTPLRPRASIHSSSVAPLTPSRATLATYRLPSSPTWRSTVIVAVACSRYSAASMASGTLDRKGCVAAPEPT